MSEATTATTGTETATAATDAGTATQTATQSTETVTDWQAEAAKWKAIARSNESRAKANADGALVTETKSQKELLSKVAQALGLESAQPDPAAITAQLETSQREAKARTRELAVLRAAAKLGADGDELLDSRQFLAGIDKLDPTDTEGLTAAIKAAVAAAPAKFGSNGAASTTQAQQGTAQQAGAQHQASTTASGGQFNGASGGQRQWTKADVDRATPAELAKAMAANLVDSYLAS
jgi:hypothetical protein